jgi:hypothetical protein
VNQKKKEKPGPVIIFYPQPSPLGTARFASSLRYHILTPTSLITDQEHASIFSREENLCLVALRLAGTALTSSLGPGEVDDGNLEERVAKRLLVN